MELTFTQKQTVEARLRGLKCPVCQAENFTATTKLYVGLEYDTPVRLGPGMDMFPFIPIICGSCSNTLLFAAKPMGLV